MNVLRKVVSREATTVARWQRRALSSHYSTRPFGARYSLDPNGTKTFSVNDTHTRQTSVSLTSRQWFSTKGDSRTRKQPDHATIIKDSNHRIQAAALQGDARQAQQALDELESLLMTTASTPEEKSAAQDSLLEGREAVLDTWISHQTALFEEWNSGENKQQQQQIVHAADKAHQALEQTVPFLAKPAVAIFAQPMRRKRSKFDDQEYDETSLLEENPPGVLGSPRTSRGNRSPQAMLHRCNSVLTAWARASRVSSAKRLGIPQRAQYLVQRMEASLAGSAAPTTESYNQVLKAWAWSQEHLKATMAEQIFQSMVNNRMEAKPDGESNKWIIQAWCQSSGKRQKRAAFKATGHLMKWLRRIERGGEEIEPTVETYQMVLQAWTQAEDRNAPIKTLGVLRMMEYAYNNNYCSVAPDETCYKHYLVTSARKSLMPEQGPLAEQILAQLKNQQIIPDHDVYTAAIQIWKNSALNPLFATKRGASIARAVELLQELSVAHHRSTLVSVKPTTENYNDVLEALSASRKAVSKTVAETLVKVMEDSEESSDIKPNADTYKWLLSVHANSRADDKVQASKQVLERLKSDFAALDDDDHAKRASEASIVGLYNAFIRVCESAEDGTDILEEALGSVQEMRSLYGLKPNSQTYASLLGVCKRHLEIGPERSRIVQSIFQGCCDEGLVNESVLKSFKAATSDEQYFHLVVSVSEGVEGTPMVPESWTSNVEGVITDSGRKVAPLSVDGKFTLTRAQKEYRMRNLRSKVNQSVLQGGRLKMDMKKRGEAIRIELDEEAFSKVN